ncbi:MAG: PqqD family protein, partial [Acidobacteria bacterium]|nr:PqqD family protein [Acidobacteriota bacterium]
MNAIERLSQLMRSDKVTQTKLADETGVILHLDTLQVLTLNETGMFLVERIGEGLSTADQLIAALTDDFEVDEATARADVDA